ncbi:hypothetical protein JGD04_24650, partial [Salmonella enterica subsp. enterica serovar Typhimurium]|nr:hypothetical protein [Salmonella enterica subsp. enterica serovar Typhimurium]
NFKMSNIVPSWFLYPVGLISSSLAGSQFGHNLFSETLAIMCIGIYFFMLPLVLYRLVFFGSLPRRARPTPSFGICAKSNARSGLPTFIITFVGSSGSSSTEERFTSNSSSPW